MDQSRRAHKMAEPRRSTALIRCACMPEMKDCRFINNTARHAGGAFAVQLHNLVESSALIVVWKSVWACMSASFCSKMKAHICRRKHAHVACLYACLTPVLDRTHPRLILVTDQACESCLFVNNTAPLGAAICECFYLHPSPFLSVLHTATVTATQILSLSAQNLILAHYNILPNTHSGAHLPSVRSNHQR